MAFIAVLADEGMEPILATAKAVGSTLILLFHDLPIACIVHCTVSIL